MRKTTFGALTLLLVLAALPARAQAPSSPGTWNGGGSSSWSTPDLSSPRGGLLPVSLFDPSRLSIHNSLAFGYSTGGQSFGLSNGSAGLFTSSLGYKLSRNMGLAVDLGAHMNPAFGRPGTSQGVFLEGAKFDWRPSANSLLRVEYRDYRSPLQNPYGFGNNGYGYGALGFLPYHN